MTRRDTSGPVPMLRIAIAAPRWALRDTLVRVAELGVVELDAITAAGEATLTEPTRLLQRLGAPAQARLSETAPDLAGCERDGRADLIAGEAELTAFANDAVVRDDVVAWLGWVAAADLDAVSTRLAEIGAVAVSLPLPRGVQPPTAAPAGPVHETFAPLVNTYGTVPYADVDPTFLAGLSYVVMFGAMFGDVGHGGLLVLGALLLRLGRFARLAPLRPYWRFVAALGVSSALFGMLYGECFGPTGVVPTIWLAPMDHPVELLAAGVGLGTFLLAGAYALGTINRVREGGWARALYAPSGIAGSAMFLAAGLAVLSWYSHDGWLAVAAVVLAIAGLALAFIGLLAAAGRTGAGVAEALVETFDLVIRIGANVMSFARLAAFGLTHAVIGWIVWTATAALWRLGSLWVVAAVLVFIVGNAAAFALEALVAAVQALRLEYYELFSRVFEREGRAFRPWRLPVDRSRPAELPDAAMPKYALAGGE